MSRLCIHYIPPPLAPRPQPPTPPPFCPTLPALHPPPSPKHTGKMTPWTGRFWTLLDPTYAKKYIPIIASVSEHQPTTWSTYVFDLHMLVFAAPAGLYFCFKTMTDSQLFLLTFALTAIYFSGIMIR